MCGPKGGFDNKVNSGKVKQYKCNQYGRNETQSYQPTWASIRSKTISTSVIFGGQWVTRYRAQLGLSNITVFNWIKHLGTNIQEYVPGKDAE